MKLSKKIKCETVNTMLLDLFSGRVTRWESETQKELLAQYLNDASSLMTWYNSLNDDNKSHVMVSSGFAAAIKVDTKDPNSSRTVILCLHPRIEVLIGQEKAWQQKEDIIAIPFGSPKYSRTRPSDVEAVSFNVENGGLPCIGGDFRSPLESPAMVKLIKLKIEEKKILEKIIKDAGETFHCALSTVTSKKKLEEVMPEAVKYLPKPEKKAGTTALAPIELYENINRMLSK